MQRAWEGTGVHLPDRQDDSLCSLCHIGTTQIWSWTSSWTSWQNAGEGASRHAPAAVEKQGGRSHWRRTVKHENWSSGHCHCFWNIINSSLERWVHSSAEFSHCHWKIIDSCATLEFTHCHWTVMNSCFNTDFTYCYCHCHCVWNIRRAAWVLSSSLTAQHLHKNSYNTKVKSFDSHRGL